MDTLRFLFDVARSLVRLSGGIVSAVLVALALVAMSLARAVHSGMITIKPELFVQMAATVIAIVALWKLLGGQYKVAGKLGTMALAGFLLANFSVRLPGTWGFGEAAIKEADGANARRAETLEVPKAVPGLSPRFTKDGSPRYYWSPSDEPPVFYDRAGIHPDKGTALRPVDSGELFEMIQRRQQEARNIPEPPKIAEAPKPASLEARPLTGPVEPAAQPEPAAEPQVAMALSEPQRISAKRQP